MMLITPIKRLVRSVVAMGRGFPEALGVFGRGLHLVMRAAPLAAARYVALVIITSVLPVAQVWLTKEIVDALTVTHGFSGSAGASDTHFGQGARGAGLPVVEPAFWPVVWYVCLLVLGAALQPVQQTLMAWLDNRAVAEVDRRLMHAGMRLADLTRVERPGFQDELKVVQQAAYRPPRLFGFIQHGLGTAVTLAGVLILVGQLHPLIPLALLVVTLPYLVAARNRSQLIYQAMQRRSRAAREMEYCAGIVLQPRAAKEVRVFGLGAFFHRRFQERFVLALAEMRQIRLRGLGISTLFGGVYAVTLAGAFGYVAAQAGAGRLTLGDVILYLSAVAQAQTRSMALPLWFGTLHEILQTLRGLFHFLDGAAPAVALPPLGEARAAPAALRTGIELRNVHFRYPESPDALPPVLGAATALLPAGKVTALVGINGAGKSTLVKLLTRMYDPTHGEILLDELPLAAYDLESLRGRIAVMYQDFAQFSMTLRHNIAVGVAHASGASDGQALAEAQARLEMAASWAGADAVARKLPHGYETELTRRFAGGVELSGGEWQKVALARAFIREASLVILDEPTAALDADAEDRLLSQFRALVEGKTALLISHRFSSVRLADHILVLEGGRIVEAGTHDALVLAGGRYATLFEMQADRYR